MGGWRSLPVAVVVGALLTVAVAEVSECEESREAQDGCWVRTTISPRPTQGQKCILRLADKTSGFSWHLRPGRDFERVMVKVSHPPQRIVGNFIITKSIVADPHKWYNVTMRSSTHQDHGNWRRIHKIYIDQDSMGEVDGSVDSNSSSHSYFVYVLGSVSVARPTSPNTRTTSQGQGVQPGLVCAESTGSVSTWRPWYAAVVAAGAAVVVAVVVLVVVRGRGDRARSQRNASVSNAEDYLGDADHDSDHIYEEVTERGTTSGESKAHRGSITLSRNSIYVPFEMTQ